MDFKRPKSSRKRLNSQQVQWPAANKDILKLFTLSRTNQILRGGHSLIFEKKEAAFKEQGRVRLISFFSYRPPIITDKSIFIIVRYR